MSNLERIDVLISALEHYSYCPRQCALIHVEQTYEENMYTMRGKLAHERTDQGDDRPSRGVITHRVTVITAAAALNCTRLSGRVRIETISCGQPSTQSHVAPGFRAG